MIIEMTKTPSMSAKTDLELVEIIKAKENNREIDKAYNVLFNRYNALIRHEYSSMINRQEIVEDIIAETFAKVVLDIHKFSAEKGALSTWLFRIARNAFLDKNRMMSRKRSVSYENSEEMECLLEGYKEEDMIVIERNKAILNAVNSMRNEMFKETIKLRFFEELSYEEISERMMITESQVKVNIFRGKAMLKKELTLKGISISCL